MLPLHLNRLYEIEFFNCFFIYVVEAKMLSPFLIRGIINIFKELLINDQIHAKEVRLLSNAGEQIGIIPFEEALTNAKEAGLDLVLINGAGNPPVCKIMDYGKFKFDSVKREKEMKKNQKVSELKCITIRRMTIDKHDMETKAKHVIKFLKNGDKVKVTLWMKNGREQLYTANALKVLNEFYDMVKEFGDLDKEPKKTGKDCMMIIVPKK